MDCGAPVMADEAAPLPLTPVPRTLSRTFSAAEAAQLPGAEAPESLTVPETASAGARLTALLVAGAVFVCTAVLTQLVAVLSPREMHSYV